MNEIKINNDDFYDCPNCKYLKRKSILSSKLEKERYDKHICDDGYIKYMNKMYDSIKSYIIGKDILDYGCGQIHALSDIINADGLSCSYYDLYYYPRLDDKLYDTIILIEVFEHILTPLEELMKMKSMLNKNGRIIIATNLRVDKLDSWWYLRDKTHVSIFSCEAIIKLAQITGFNYEIIKESNLIILSSI